MPLLDHFHPPLSAERHWESFHTTWAGSIADALNRQLPEGYFAEEQLQPSARVEVDVAAFEEEHVAESGGGVATRTSWRPAAPAWSLPGQLPEGLAIHVFASEGGPRLVGAIELVSPANKDRPAARRAFAIKCASYLHQGIGLLTIDVVTSRNACLHSELGSLLGWPPAAPGSGSWELSAFAYRPVRRSDQDWIDVWPERLTVGRALPELPLWLGPELVMPVNLESTYVDACRRRRLAP
jgi:hypothetical protein